MEHKKMADYTYHYGLKVRIYPSQQQKEMIRRNADAARCVYNEHVAVNKEIARFGRRSIYIDFIEKRIEALRERIRTVTALKDRYPWLRHPDIDAQSIANARQNYQHAWKQFRASIMLVCRTSTRKRPSSRIRRIHITARAQRFPCSPAMSVFLTIIT